jgi:hypothetical protein
LFGRWRGDATETQDEVQDPASTEEAHAAHEQGRKTRESDLNGKIGRAPNEVDGEQRQPNGKTTAETTAETGEVERRRNA